MPGKACASDYPARPRQRRAQRGLGRCGPPRSLLAVVRRVAAAERRPVPVPTAGAGRKVLRRGDAQLVAAPRALVRARGDVTAGGDWFGHVQILPASLRRSRGARAGEDAGKPAVELRGFEPLTSSMPWKRATNCAKAPYRCAPESCDPAARTREDYQAVRGVTKSSLGRRAVRRRRTRRRASSRRRGDAAARPTRSSRGCRTCASARTGGRAGGTSRPGRPARAW